MMDKLTQLSQEAIERRMTIYDKPTPLNIKNPVLVLDKKFTSEEIDRLIEEWDKEPLRIMEPLDPAIIEIDRLNRELEAAATYIEENEVIHKKFKKNIPTVIEYKGRRYVLDDRN